jgi:prenylcysteine oxidase/farnesylcysteine lyase
VTDKIASLYEPSVQTWSSIEELNNALNWTELVSQTGAEYFQNRGISQKFTNEFIGARTRVHYAQARRTARLPPFSN